MGVLRMGVLRMGVLRMRWWKQSVENEAVEAKR
jgi:hypothetical protein